MNIKTAAAVAVVCALALPRALLADEYKDLSLHLSRCAIENSLKKVAVLDFTAKGGAGKSETEYVAEKVGIFMAGNHRFALIERSMLEKLLKETRLSSLAGGTFDKAEILKNIFSVDAVVTGTVFANGDKLKILSRLIDLKTGGILFAEEIETGRMPPDFAEASFDGMGLPEVPMPTTADWTAAAVPSRQDLRDAIAGLAASSCPDRKRVLNKLNAELVDAKARYWAARVWVPGFDISKLTRNPGSEIGDPGVKAEFYKLLSDYHDSESPPPQDTGRLSAVMDLMERETKFANECGI